VTIDFGDGRKIERTLTGNSIHYVLDDDGRPIDAIPGLYGPAAFLKQLNQAIIAFRTLAKEPAANRDRALRSYHQSSREAAIRQFTSDVAQTGARLSPLQALMDPDTAPPSPSAAQAAPRAVSKMAGEFKTLKLIGAADPRATGPMESYAAGGPPMPGIADNDMSEWEKIAALHVADARLDASSLSLIRSQYPSLEPAHPMISRIEQNFERYVAIDTVRNEYLMHATLHQWFAQGSAGPDVEILNERVYAKLFLTPRSDPWLGLLLPETYTGLVNGGIIGDR
jgi:hypothetical protein